MKQSTVIVNLLGVLILVLLVLTGVLGWRNASLENTNAELLRDRNEWVEKYRELENVIQDNWFEIRQMQLLIESLKTHSLLIERINTRPPDIQTITLTEIVTEYVTEYVEVLVYPELRNFESLEELRAWDDGWEYAWNNTDGVTQFGAGGNNDCDDWVIQWVQDAVNAGYFAGFGIDTERGHLIASVIIGNDYWFIDPSTDEIYNTLNNSTWTVD